MSLSDFGNAAVDQRLRLVGALVQRLTDTQVRRPLPAAAAGLPPQAEPSPWLPSCPLLVATTAHLQPASERHRQLVGAALENVTHHRFGDADPRVVDELVDRQATRVLRYPIWGLIRRCSRCWDVHTRSAA